MFMPRASLGVAWLQASGGPAGPGAAAAGAGAGVGCRMLAHAPSASKGATKKTNEAKDEVMGFTEAARCRPPMAASTASRQFAVLMSHGKRCSAGKATA